MKVLFIGGSGVISSACTQLAIEKGLDLTLLNRGKSTHDVPAGVKTLHADIRDPKAVLKVLGKQSFDVVVNWIAFTPDHIETDLKLFRGRTGQYIFISSASIYQTPPKLLPITESTPLYNPYWAYSRNKIACEERLVRAYQEEDFPMTIVRPSHTYDQTKLPLQGQYTVVDRMRKGEKIVVHGDGTSLWVLTHHRDFARGLVGLLAHPQSIGQAIHITSDEVLTWNQIAEMIARAAGVDAQIVHIPSQIIARHHSDWGDSLMGDKAHSVIFDNTKIKQLVPDYVATIPFARGIEEVIAWYDADPARQMIDHEFDQLIDRLITAYEKVTVN